MITYETRYSALKPSDLLTDAEQEQLRILFDSLIERYQSFVVEDMIAEPANRAWNRGRSVHRHTSVKVHITLGDSDD